MAIYSMDINNSNNAKASEIILASEHNNYLKRQGKFAPDYQKENNKELLKKVEGSEHINYIQRKEVFSKIEKYEDLVLALDANMPEWAKENPDVFWINADKYEKGNRIKYHSFILSLPEEFTDEENINLVKTYCEKTFSKDFVYSVGIHKKKSRDEKHDNPHVHIMFSDRKLDGVKREPEIFFKRANLKNPTFGGASKDRKWNSIFMYRRERKNWENILNLELEKKGLEKVSCETLEKQLQLAIEEKDLLKQIYLDRPAINCPGRILQKIDKVGFEKLSKREKELFQNYEKAKKMRDITLEAIEKIKTLQKENKKEDNLNINSKKENIEIFFGAKNVIQNRCKKLFLEQRKMKKDLFNYFDEEMLKNKFFGIYHLSNLSLYQNENFDIKSALIDLSSQKTKEDASIRKDYFSEKDKEELAKLNRLENESFEFKPEYYLQLSNLKEEFLKNQTKLNNKKIKILESYNDFYNKLTFDFNLKTLITYSQIKNSEKDEIRKYYNLLFESLKISDEIEKKENLKFLKILNGKKIKVLKEKLNKNNNAIEVLKEKLNKIIKENFKELSCDFIYQNKSKELSEELSEKWYFIKKELNEVEKGLDLNKISCSYIDSIMNDVIKLKKEYDKNQSEKNNNLVKLNIKTFAQKYSDYLINYLKLKNAVFTYENETILKKIGEKTNTPISQVKEKYLIVIKDLNSISKELEIEFNNLKSKIDLRYIANNYNIIFQEKNNIINSFKSLKNSKKYYNNKSFENIKDFINYIVEKKKIKSFYNIRSLEEKIKSILENDINENSIERKIQKNIKKIKEISEFKEKDTSLAPANSSFPTKKEIFNGKEENIKKRRVYTNKNTSKNQSKNQFIGKVENFDDYFDRMYGKKKKGIER